MQLRQREHLQTFRDAQRVRDLILCRPGLDLDQAGCQLREIRVAAAVNKIWIVRERTVTHGA